MTARISIQDARLKIERTGVARWFGASLDVPLAHVVSVHPASPDHVRAWNKGVRLAGIQLPGVMASGIYRHGGQLTWWDVGRGTNAIDITIRDERLSRAVIEVDDPSVIRTLTKALADTALPAEPTAGRPLGE